MLDYHLPGMTGVEIAARLAPGTPVLLVSSDPAAGARWPTCATGARGTCRNPYEVDLFVDLVSLLLGAK